MTDSSYDPFGPRTASGIPLPVVHLNGTGRDTLHNEYVAAHAALKIAIEALQNCTFHERDYYVHRSPGAFATARGIRRNMFQKLEDVKDYVNDHITAVSRNPTGQAPRQRPNSPQPSPNF